MKNKILYILLIIFSFATACQLHAQNSIDFSLGANKTLLKDEINSLNNFSGIVPSTSLVYTSKNNKRYYQTGFDLSMGNPTQVHDFRSLYIELKLGYKYLRKVSATTKITNYGGGGLQSYGHFLISDLGKTTYMYETSINLNYMVDIPFRENTISLSSEIPLLSLLSRSPYAVFSPEIREQLESPITIPFYNSRIHSPVGFWRFSGTACINRNLGKRWNMGLNYRYEYIHYRNADELDYTQLINSVSLVAKFRFINQ